MNKAILMGRLTRDPEHRTTQNNNTVANFTIAVDRRFKNANGEREADFIPCVAWRQTAEFIAQYFRQGQRIAVVGSIQPRSWDDDNGERHYVTEVIVDEAYFADSKADSGSGGGNRSSYSGRGNTRDNGRRQPRQQEAYIDEDAGEGLPFDL